MIENTKHNIRKVLEELQPGDGICFDHKCGNKANFRRRVFQLVNDLNGKRSDIKLFTDGQFVTATGDYKQIVTWG